MFVQGGLQTSQWSVIWTSQVLPVTLISVMSTERVKGENKTKHKKKEDIIILETIKEIKDRKKIKANSGRKS